MSDAHPIVSSSSRSIWMPFSWRAPEKHCTTALCWGSASGLRGTQGLRGECCPFHWDTMFFFFCVCVPVYWLFYVFCLCVQPFVCSLVVLWCSLFICLSNYPATFTLCGCTYLHLSMGVSRQHASWRFVARVKVRFAVEVGDEVSSVSDSGRTYDRGAYTAT